MRQRDLNEQFQIVLSGMNNANLAIIKKKEQYLNDANIAAVQLAYRIFNINIIFYNVDANGLRIDRYPENINPQLHTVHIIRKDDIHFELLIPMDDPIVGLAAMIRDARMEADELEEERDTLIARIYAKELRRTLASVNEEFKDKIDDVHAEQEEAEEEASNIMTHPEYQETARQASLRAVQLFHKNHIANFSNAIQQFHVESIQEPGAAVNVSYEPGAAPVKKTGPKIAPSLVKLAQEKSNMLLAAKLAQEASNAAFAASFAQEESNAAFAHQLSKQLEAEQKPKKKGPKLPPKKGGTRKRRGHVRKTKKLKKRTV
jgi:hypothetical protein